MHVQRAMILMVLLLYAFEADASGDDASRLLYRQEKNVVYAETDGIGLVMDVFTPVQNANGLAIVEVASGAWHSDRGKIRDLEKTRLFDIFCERGYTVFAVRPGSITKFSALEMAANVKKGIQWVKSHAEEYRIESDRLGLLGASAGGHLASLVAVTSREGDEPDSSVAAVGVFFPPTDFLDYGGLQIDPRDKENRLGEMLRRLAFKDGVDGLDDQQIGAALTAISPARQVRAGLPPFLFIHGSLDFMVPLQQSKAMLAALQNKDVPSRLIIKPGGGHPWPTIHEEVAVMADWFDEHLVADR